MDEIPGWIDWVNANPEKYKRIMQSEQKYSDSYVFPEILDKEECRQSTIDFACERLDILALTYLRLRQLSLVDNPIYEIYCREYPLPIGSYAIKSTYHHKRWYWTELQGFEGFPLVGKRNAFIGIAKRFQNGGSIGWFLGLVEVLTHYSASTEELGYYSENERPFIFINPPFKFIEGMILLEGNLDGSVIRQLEDYKDYYDKNVLGLIIRGRPRSNIQEWIEKVRPYFLQNPDLTQDKLAEYLRVNITSVRKNRIKAGFDTYDEFRKSFRNS